MSGYSRFSVEYRDEIHFFFPINHFRYMIRIEKLTFIMFFVQVGSASVGAVLSLYVVLRVICSFDSDDWILNSLTIFCGMNNYYSFQIHIIFSDGLFASVCFRFCFAISNICSLFAGQFCGNNCKSIGEQFSWSNFE